eukprot:Lankesteria_metandrocarpae@DN5800_c0_g1_i1.p1
MGVSQSDNGSPIADNFTSTPVPVQFSSRTARDSVNHNSSTEQPRTQHQQTTTAHQDWRWYSLLAERHLDTVPNSKTSNHRPQFSVESSSTHQQRSSGDNRYRSNTVVDHQQPTTAAVHNLNYNTHSPASAVRSSAARVAGQHHLQPSGRSSTYTGGTAAEQQQDSTNMLGSGMMHN